MSGRKVSNDKRKQQSAVPSGRRGGSSRGSWNLETMDRLDGDRHGQLCLVPVPAARCRDHELRLFRLSITVPVDPASRAHDLGKWLSARWPST